MRWPLTFYTNLGMDETTSGTTRGPVILIKPGCKDDEGLYQHELTHVKQSFMGLIIFDALLYRFYAPYRLWAEVEAYKKQARYYADDRREKFAGYIATYYDLDVSRADTLLEK